MVCPQVATFVPELPDLTIYGERVRALASGHPLLVLRIHNPFVLRTVSPPPTDFAGRVLERTSRIGKRIVLHFDGTYFALMHLMRAGRLRWIEVGRKPPARITLATFEFAHGTLAFTEAGTKRRASLHLAQHVEALASFDAGGLEPLDIDFGAFATRLRVANHTLKRALTEPKLFAGVGNAYSDEILHRARLSPLARTQALDEAELRRLFDAMRAVLSEWTDRLRREAGNAGLPEVTAFRPEMAVHGRFGLPCPACRAPVQRIVYADNETNYCARCQNEGRVLADRALSRLLKDNWPRSIDDFE